MASQPYTTTVPNVAFNSSNGSASGPCKCCPYGFHIDTDFVRYCDALLTALYGNNRNFSNTTCRSFGSLRRKFNFAFASPELFLQPNAKSPPYCDLSDKDNASRNGGTFKSYLDKERNFSFKERHLEHLSHGHIQRQSYLNSSLLTEHDSFASGCETESVLSEAVNKFEEVLLESQSSSKSTLNSPAANSNVPDSPPPSPAPSSCTSSVSKSVLTQIRNHLALSLTRVKELENQVAQIPHLHQQIILLQSERDELLSKVPQPSAEDACCKDFDSSEPSCTLQRLSPIGRDIETSEEMHLDTSSKQSLHESLSNDATPTHLSFTKCESISIPSTFPLKHTQTQPIEMRSVGTLTSFAPSLPRKNAFIQTEILSKDVTVRVNVVSVETYTDQVEKYAVSCQASPEINHSATNTTDLDLESEFDSNGLASAQIESQDASVQVSISQHEQQEVPSICLDPTISSTELSECAHRPTSLDLMSDLSNQSLFTPKSVVSSLNCSSSPSSSSQSLRLCDKCNEMVHSVTSDPSCSQDISAISLPKIIKSDSGISVERRQIDNKAIEESYILASDLEMSSSLNTQSSDDHEQPIKDVAKRQKKPIDYNSVQPSNETKTALNAINEHLNSNNKSNNFAFSKNVSLVKKVWFKVSSTEDSDSRIVEIYIDCFEKISSKLLNFVVNLADSNSNTAMHYAISYNNFDIVSVLLDSKVCDLNKYNKAGYTASMLVSLAKIENDIYRDVVNRLFHQADINLKAKQNQQSALMLAASHGNFESCQILLQCGAEVNLQDKDGSSALMCAAEHGHANIISLLLSHPDCDPLLEDNEGSTALKIALVNGHNEAGILLYTGTRITNYYTSSCYSSLSRLGNSPANPSHLRRTTSFSYSPGQSASHNLSALSLRTSPPRSRHYSMSTPSSPSHT